MKRLFKKQMNKRPNKRRRILVLISLLIVAGLIGYFGREAYVNAQPCGSSSNNKLYSKAADAIAGEDLNELEYIVKQIESIDGYEKSVNCVYPAYSYYVMTDDIYNAEVMYQKLQKSYFAKGQKVSPAYKDTGFSSLDAVRKKLDRKIKKQLENANEYYI